MLQKDQKFSKKRFLVILKEIQIISFVWKISKMKILINFYLKDMSRNCKWQFLDPSPAHVTISHYFRVPLPPMSPGK